MGNNGSTNSFPNTKKMNPDDLDHSNHNVDQLRKDERDSTPVKATDRQSVQFTGYANGKPNAGGRN